MSMLAVLAAGAVGVGCSASAGDEPQVPCKTTICEPPDDGGGAPDANPDSGSPTTDGATTTDASSDAAFDAGAKGDSRASDSTVGDSSSASDSSSGADSAATDSATGTDTRTVDTGSSGTDTATGNGPITGGPCLSGTAGATAFRFRYTNSGGYAQASYEKNGLPSGSSLKVSFGGPGPIPGPSPQYGDTGLAQGGLELEGENFIDVHFSTVGIASITKATLLVYGRSYSTGSSGSFRWISSDGAGASASAGIANSTPYQWYGTEVTTGVLTNKSILLRIKAGPPSASLVVNSFELCVEAS